MQVFRRSTFPFFSNKHLFVFWIICCCLSVNVFAQQHRAPCLSSINAFPYDEGFESSAGDWFTGGQNSDWTLGTPSKTVISAAGQGTKCWVIGGLTGSQYNGGQLSWIQSPCFDISSLANPEISFKVLWESERRFDGASFEYSIDGGATWLMLGSTSSNTNCKGTNWFNNAAIMYLGNGAGWSGNIQSTSGSCLGGSGSNGWVTARHSLIDLLGESNVTFRFTFGSGTTCNNFQGFAFDAVHIGEAPPNNADYTYTCNASTNRSVSFSQNARCAASTLWDFGDVTSGAANSSTDANPTHVFSAAGEYKVRLTTTFASAGPPSITEKFIRVLDASASVVNPLKCFGNSNGSVTSVASGSNTTYTYSWNTSPVITTATAANLAAGSYTVQVGSPNSCPATATVVLQEPPALSVSTTVLPTLCTGSNGSITSTVSGGTAPYGYLWSNNATTSSIKTLPAGNYSLKVTDQNGCSFTTGQLAVMQEQRTLSVSIGKDTFICPGNRLVLSPGNFRQYRWQDNSTASAFNVLQTGTYSVTVTDENGCTGMASVNVTVDCSDVYFPSGFSPNGDSRNELFGPVGNVAAVRNYRLTVYDRFGNRAFYSTDPYRKWNGRFNGEGYNSGSFVWIASYTLNGKPYTKKGTLILIR
ncbi:gliding motility-associated C-terminal domain-containing protein [Ferruginibacter sp. HRS2-29]|uniref:T9SS type B sorting domain-containing protein n=1 Tax=Ferruginibacter sp. HRS2-29 TaxID=2487334 RepID=UPI0020CCA91C|nr:gliding motility-associated C-terminal domain-containing protein [Ferruginibacter sp. HRS2-29]MCP9750716.1 PKD domain-containing protein [Ferruginibacter sp. HRS2-29]